jgi:hypothetical protein
MSKLFEEAIADAKKLKEVAEENAKKAILESVTPRIREFIEAQLLEQDDELQDDEMYEEDEADEDIVLDEASLNSLINMLGGNEVLSSLKEGTKGNKNILSKSIKAAAGNLSSDNREKLLSLTNKINENIDTLSEVNINNNVKENQENDLMSRKSEKYYEVDLKTLREAVEDKKDILEMSDLYEQDDEEAIDLEDELDEDIMNEIKLMLDLGDDVDEDQIPEDLKSMLFEEEPEEGEAEEEPEEGEEGEEFAPEELEGLEEPPEDEELEEVFDVDPSALREELLRIRRSLRESKNMESSFGGAGKKNAGVKGAFGGGKEGQDAFTNPPQLNKLNEAIRQLRRKNRSQTEKLNKYRSAVSTLREQLEDLNLFNAKLLYVNKLLQNKQLSESQKKSVIKALDEAKSLGETKALYKSLTESMCSSRSTLNETARYGSSSRVTTSSSSKNQTVGEINRWQKLAGLK